MMDPAVGVMVGDPATADWLIEVPHGADEGSFYERARSHLTSPLPADLVDFFHVNTDVGSWALATELAEELEASGAAVCLIRCHIPRTFIDVNRVVDEALDGMTPGLQPWIVDRADQQRLLALHQRYTDRVAAAYAEVCGRGGRALIPHTYAPRTVPIQTVDETIVEQLHHHYVASRLETYPLRPELDFITHTPDGEDLALPGVEDVIEALSTVGVSAHRGGSYALHPVTMGARWSALYPGQVLCFEVRRDLVTHWDPFRPKKVRAEVVKRIAKAMASVWIG